MKYIAFLLILISAPAFAGQKCFKVYNSKHVKKCITKISYSMESEGELPHTVGVTRKKRGFKFMQEILDQEEKSIEGGLEQFHYLSVVEVHYDEDELLYFGIRRGRSTEPVLLLQTSVVDLEELEVDEPDTEALLFKYSLGIKKLEDFHLN